MLFFGCFITIWKEIKMFQLKWVWEQMKGYHLKYICALILSVFVAILFVLVPWFGGEIVRIFIESPDAAQNIQEKPDLLWLLCGGMVGFTLIRTLLQLWNKTLYEQSSQGTIFKIRNKMFEIFQNQDMHFYHTHSKGDLVTRMTGDLDLIRHTIAWIVMIFVEGMGLLVFTISYFMSIDWLLTLAILAPTPILLFVIRRFSHKIGPVFAALREKLSLLNNKAQESIAANRVIKAFAREEYEKFDFDKYNIDYRDKNVDVGLTWLKYQPHIEILSQSLWVIQLAIGGIFVINGRISFAEYSVVGNLLWTIANTMRNFGFIINDLQRFFASVDKIIELYYITPSIINEHKCEIRERIGGSVEFKNVSLKISGSEILKNVSFRAEEGETVVIMGPTGAGKTMMMNLVARFYDATHGAVLVGGKNVKEYEPDLLRSNIGMTTQEVLLFSDTVDGNIAYGDSDMSEEAVREYAEKAAAGFIEKMPEGFDTIIGERGVGLSGGQKQRIALARALAIRPPVLILDDTTSAVDAETEIEIQQNLKNLDFGCTKLIIAQRTSTARNADKIIIIRDGEIVESGTHKELMELGGYYHEIYCLQNDEAESA